MDALPLELYHPIIKHLDKTADIAAVLRCSKALQRECEPLLYNHIIFDPTPRVFFNMTRNPRTATMIRSLTFFIIGWFAPPGSIVDTQWTVQTEAERIANLELIHCAFGALPNLKYLNLASSRPLGMDLAFGTALDNVPFKLDTFLCQVTQDWDIHRFLSGQTELKTLGWRPLGRVVGIDPFPSFQPGDLPYLRNIFNVSTEILAEVVPGRPICRVQQDLYAPSLFLSLSRSSAKVEVLVIKLLPLNQSILEDFRRHTPHLRYLGCLSTRENVSMQCFVSESARF